MRQRSQTPSAHARVNPMWMAAALLAALAGLLIAAWAIRDLSGRSKPIGEGELFAAEVATAVTEYEERMTTEGLTPSDAVRHIRNRLLVESVGAVDEGGTYVASTSASFAGKSLAGYLASALDRGAFAAIAEPIESEVLIDGVVEWSPGDILYRVFAPLPEGGGLVLEYDVSALLARRASQASIRPIHVAAGVAAISLLAGAALILLAREGARRRAESTESERRLLEERSTELETYNRELDRARGEAERALALAEETNRIRSEFVLMINHELRTPLTSIVTGSELLASQWDSLTPTERNGLLEDVVADGRRLKELITQMLVVARIENRGLQYELRRVGVDSIKTKLEELSPRTSLWPDGQEMPELLTDAETLSHLIVSLADNARTHGAQNVSVAMSEGLPFEPMIEVGIRPQSGAFFLITDDGPGIDESFLPNIFEKFEKRGRSSGTGLGLYLAKLMVDGIEGSISVTTGPSGTTMAVAIPRWSRQQLRVAV